MPAGVWSRPKQLEPPTPRRPTVERSPSRSGPRAQACKRLTRGALNAAPERYDVTPRGTQEAARQGANTKRRRQNIRAGSR
ncbi:hypothetical protein MRX96_014462 [Rhipicephalus microplus]